MARTLIILGLAAAALATPLAKADTYLAVERPDLDPALDPHLTASLGDEIVLGPFCQTPFFCYDQYVCPERAGTCCPLPKPPEGVGDPGIVYCKAT